MEIILNSKQDIVIVSRQIINDNKITRGAVVDDESKKIVVAFYSVGKSTESRLTLWQGAEYDAIGNWTYTQVDARIKELLGVA